MTKKDFFILIIKLFGLYSIITALFTYIPQSISFGFYTYDDIDFYPVFYITVMLALVVALFVLLIFKSPYIVRIFKLEEGFDNDNLELGNLSAKEIIKIATLIIGGFLIINNLPIFIQSTLSAFYQELQFQTTESVNKWNWFLPGANVLIGYLLITNVAFVAQLINGKEQTDN
jgi:hypothetical protein